MNNNTHTQREHVLRTIVLKKHWCVDRANDRSITAWTSVGTYFNKDIECRVICDSSNRIRIGGLLLTPTEARMIAHLLEKASNLADSLGAVLEPSNRAVESPKIQKLIAESEL
jgi:hypothetical protein